MYQTFKKKIKKMPFSPIISRIHYKLNKTIKYIPEKISQIRIKNWYSTSGNVERIRALKNIHSGKRCFIIGNGPSLDFKQLDKIYSNGDISFSANRIYLALNKTSWTPYYYMVGDAGMVVSDYQDIVKIDCKQKFVGVEYDLKPVNLYKKIDDIVVYRKVTKLKKKVFPTLSKDFSDHSSGAHTILSDAFQLAMYMGFTEIYLIGVDCKYSAVVHKGKVQNGNELSHFYKADETKNTPLPSSDTGYKMMMAWESIREFAEKNNIKVYNATYGGSLEVFERVKFDSLFE